MAKQQHYGSDLIDQEWQRPMPLLPLDKIVGRWRTTNLREILNAIFYRVNNKSKNVNKTSLVLTDFVE